MKEIKYYAGIGSRETPIRVEPMIEEVGRILSRTGYILRSGGAPGADSMFEKYHTGEKEIYLPWSKFNNNGSKYYLESFSEDIIEKSMKIAKSYHPRWNQLSQAAKKLMCRNTFQVLGIDLNTPIDFIVCWTKGGTINGGTGQAMRIAKGMGIPIFNLFDKDCLHKIKLEIIN